MKIEHKKWLGALAAALLVSGSWATAQDEAAPEAAAEEVAVEEAAEAEAEAEAAAEAPAAPVKPRPSEIKPLTSKSLLLDIVNAGDRLFAVGDRGAVIASVDGKEWAQVETPVRSPLTAVYFADAENGWAVGHDAAILHTADGGRSWVLQNFQPELEKPFLDVLFLDTQRGFAVGAYGLMYATTDGGETWAEVDSPIREEELHFNSITRLNNGALLVVGEQATAALSTDAGATWSKLTSPYEGSLFGAVPVGASGAMIFGLRGHVFLSQDVAAGNWTSIDGQTVASMFGGAALPDGRVAMVGFSGMVLLMDANGGNVQQVRTPTGTPLSAAVPFGGGLLAVGESGVQAIALK